MARVAIIAQLSVFLFALASAQQQQCTLDLITAGIYFVPQVTYVEMFISCHANTDGTPSICAAGTTFDTVTRQCKHYVDTTSSVCSCTNTLVTCPSVCSDKYFECVPNGGGLRRRSCDAGSIFDAGFGNCVRAVENPATRDYMTFCHRHIPDPNVGTVDPRTPCDQRTGVYFRPATNGNTCFYDQVDPTAVPEVRWPNRPCAGGTAFSPQTCTCVLSDTCGPAVSDGPCPITLGFDFQGGNHNAYTTVNGRRVTTDLSAEFTAVTFGNNLAMFRPGNQGEDAFMYVPFFTHKDLRAPFALSLSFSAQQQSTFTLISNQRDVCRSDPSLTVRAIVNTQGVSVVVDVTGVNRNGVRVTDSLTSTSIRSNNFVRFTLMYSNGVVTGRLVGDRGATADFGPSTNIGESLVNVGCGFDIGRGFNGDLRDFLFYDGCTDMSLVAVNP